MKFEEKEEMNFGLDEVNEFIKKNTVQSTKHFKNNLPVNKPDAISIMIQVKDVAVDFAKKYLRDREQKKQEEKQKENESGADVWIVILSIVIVLIMMFIT